MHTAGLGRCGRRDMHTGPREVWQEGGVAYAYRA